MSNIFFLIGMPGAGKTYWGATISGSLDCAFADLDKYIEQKEGKTVPEIFACYGEDHFRKLEQEALQELVATAAAGSRIVIACGGGTPCYFDNLDYMMEYGTVIYIRARLDTLISHLAAQPGFRPLLDNDVLQEKIYELIEDRSYFYEQANHIVDVENLSVATFDEIFRSCIEEH